MDNKKVMELLHRRDNLQNLIFEGDYEGKINTLKKEMEKESGDVVRDEIDNEISLLWDERDTIYDEIEEVEKTLKMEGITTEKEFEITKQMEEEKRKLEIFKKDVIDGMYSNSKKILEQIESAEKFFASLEGFKTLEDMKL